MRKATIFLIAILIFTCAVEVILRIAGDLYLKKLYVHQHSYIKLPPTGINVVCLGESSTAGLWVPWRDSYPAQLQAMLREEYPKKDIHVFVPPHVGQNTSQVANRIQHYIELFKPNSIILMVGYNNEWSLAESHIGKFVNLNSFESMKIKTLILLNNLRLFKLLRYTYLKYIVKEELEYTKRLEATKYAWGGPELVRLPPKKFVYSFAASRREAFVKLWRYDVHKIISVAKKHNINVILMTYQIMPTYLPVEEFIAMAHKEDIPLVRNDKTFQALINNRTIKDYVLQRDNWHPNKKGYTLIAQNAFQIIKDNKLLNE